MSKPAALPALRIEHAVWTIRGQRVMLDADLAALYEVPTKVLNQAVQRNLERFPEDFMFRLTHQELAAYRSHIVALGTEQYQRLIRSRSQIVTLKSGRGTNIKYLPHAFTEQGIAMLSSVLRSDRAVQVNIEIMRAFVKLRSMMQSQDVIKRELASLKRQYKDHDDQIKTIFLMIDEIIAPAPIRKKRKIGFLRDSEE